MSCEWIYEGEFSCPKCGWASYGARFVYGDRAYKFKITQEPWKRRKIVEFEQKLEWEIITTNPINKTLPKGIEFDWRIK
jgi:hypothetical protein